MLHTKLFREKNLTISLGNKGYFWSSCEFCVLKLYYKPRIFFFVLSMGKPAPLRIRIAFEEFWFKFQTLIIVKEQMFVSWNWKLGSLALYQVKILSILLHPLWSRVPHCAFKSTVNEPYLDLLIRRRHLERQWACPARRRLLMLLDRPAVNCKMGPKIRLTWSLNKLWY